MASTATHEIRRLTCWSPNFVRDEFEKRVNRVWILAKYASIAHPRIWLVGHNAIGLNSIFALCLIIAWKIKIFATSYGMICYFKDFCIYRRLYQTQGLPFTAALFHPKKFVRAPPPGTGGDNFCLAALRSFTARQRNHTVVCYYSRFWLVWCIPAHDRPVSGTLDCVCIGNSHGSSGNCFGDIWLAARGGVWEWPMVLSEREYIQYNFAKPRNGTPNKPLETGGNLTEKHITAHL